MQPNTPNHRVGIMTFPHSISHGAFLQMYALYREVEQLGYTPEVIHYSNRYLQQEKHAASYQKTGQLRHQAKLLAKKMLHNRFYRGFRRSEKLLKLYPKRVCSEESQLQKDRYAAAICGSDQVWNPDIINRDMVFFLHFCTDATKRIAYAPSFGVEQIDEAYQTQIRKELEKFHAISVREVQGQQILEQLGFADVPVVADPTLLHTGDWWQHLEQPCRKLPGEYILYYVVHRSPELWKFCKHLSKTTGLPILVAGGNVFSNLKEKNPQVHYAPDSAPGQWLYLLHNARYVVTNSFHGTAFSINYRKDFYVEYPHRFSSRIRNLLQQTGLTHRAVTENWPDVTDVDYTYAQEQLRNLREMSCEYLKNALKDEDNG